MPMMAVKDSFPFRCHLSVEATNVQ